LQFVVVGNGRYLLRSRSTRVPLSRTAAEAGELAKVVQGFAQTVATADLEQRFVNVEEQLK
jgi:hypothetical protein